MTAPPSTPHPEYPPSTAIGADERVRLRRDVAWNLVPVALLGIVGLGLNFAIVGWWDAEALALFNLATIALFVFAVIGSWGIQYSVLRAVAEVAHDRDRVAAVVVGALVPNVALAAAVTVVFVALRGPIAALLDSDGVGVGMSWAALGLACFAINKVLFGIVNGLRRMRAFASYTSLRYVLIAIGVLGARYLRVPAEHLPGIWSFAEGSLLVVLSVELVATVSLRRAFVAGRDPTWRAWSRRHLQYGARGVTATLAYEINTKLDVWMLGAFHVEKSLVGVYSLVAALNEGVTQLGVVVQNNLNPLIASAYSVGEVVQTDALVQRTRRWFVPAFVAVCAIGVIAYPMVIPKLVNDPRFTAGTVPFVLLMAGLALASAYLPFNQILLMTNRPGWHTVFIVTVVAVNFVVDVIAIPLLGLPGAALGTALAVVSSAILVRTMARRLTGVRL